MFENNYGRDKTFFMGGYYMNDKVEIVKFVDGEFNLDVNISPFENTLWINIDQIALLFERDRSVISKHIKNIFLEGELNENSVCAFFAHTANDGIVYKKKYVSRDRIARNDYKKLISEDALENTYIIDIIRKEIKNDDPSLRRIIFK